MPAYMVIKIFRDGILRTEFFQDIGSCKTYLQDLREIERAYRLFAWTGISYTQVEAWTPDD